MRRLCAAGTTVVMCLALGGPPGLAQETEQGAVAVTGTQVCSVPNGRCIFTASDPRVAGTGTVSTPVGPVSTGEGIPVFIWDEVVLEGPDGTWSGHHYAVADETGTTQVFMVLSGTGADFVHFLRQIQGVRDHLATARGREGDHQPLLYQRLEDGLKGGHVADRLHASGPTSQLADRL